MSGYHIIPALIQQLHTSSNWLLHVTHVTFILRSSRAFDSKFESNCLKSMICMVSCSYQSSCYLQHHVIQHSRRRVVLHTSLPTLIV